MKKLTILLVIITSLLFTCSNKSFDINEMSNLKAENDVNIILTGEFSIIEEINALSYSDKKNILILAMNIFHEARGENLDGQIAVTNVVFNRVHSKLYPDNIIDVVYQNKQFSWTLMKDRTTILKKELKSWIKSQELAFIVYTNSKYSKSKIDKICLHYVNKDIINHIKWTKNFTKRKIIGQHVFLMKGETNA